MAPEQAVGQVADSAAQDQPKGHGGAGCHHAAGEPRDGAHQADGDDDDGKSQARTQGKGDARVVLQGQVEGADQVDCLRQVGYRKRFRDLVDKDD